MSIELLRALIRETIQESELSEKRRSEDEEGPGRPPDNPSDPLRVWADEHGGQEAAADKVGVSLPQWEKIVGGRSGVSLDTAVKIEDMTSGKIPVERWVAKKTKNKKKK